MAYSLPTDIALQERTPGVRRASPKTHTPVSQLQERGYRYYSPHLGRWLSRDPIGERGGENVYGFVLGRPVDVIDPLGKNPAASSCASVLLSSSITITPWLPVIGLGGLIIWEAWVITDEIREIYRERCQRCEPVGTVANQTRTPANGAPNSRQRFPDGTEREYGPDGRATKDIDRGHDHGPGDPHIHDWDWNRTPPRQPGRPPAAGEIP